MSSLYERLGPETFHLLVERFYAGVAEDAVLRPLYPDEDFAAAPHRLEMFLVQYWGGPHDYQERARPPPAADAPRARSTSVPPPGMPGCAG